MHGYKKLKYNYPNYNFLKILMDFSKILIILLGSIFIYLSFLILGFKLRNQNIKAQNISKKEKWFSNVQKIYMQLKIYLFLLLIFCEKYKTSLI